VYDLDRRYTGTMTSLRSAIGPAWEIMSLSRLEERMGQVSLQGGHAVVVGPGPKRDEATPL